MSVASLCPELPHVSRLSGLVTRVMGLNPGPFTLTGSCTYLVGSGPKKTLIDTGGGVAKYTDLLQEALAMSEATAGSATATPATIERILLTHNHEDHIGGIEQVVALCKEQNKALGGDGSTIIPIYKLPCASRPDVAGDATLRGMIQRSGGGGELNSFIPIKAGDVFDAGPGCTLSVLFTPGHCEDHVVFNLDQEEAMFTGDTVLGHGTTVFMNYPDFMGSLSSLVAMDPKKLYPGHGPVVEDAIGKLNEYIDHRNKREVQIYDCLVKHTQEAVDSNNNEDGATTSVTLTAMEIVERVYLDTAKNLYFAAAMNVSHHLKKLWREGKVSPNFTHSSETTESDSGGAHAQQKKILEENEYLMDKGKETTPERVRVELLISIPWKLEMEGGVSKL